MSSKWKKKERKESRNRKQTKINKRISRKKWKRKRAKEIQGRLKKGPFKKIMKMMRTTIFLRRKDFLRYLQAKMSYN